VTLPSFRPTRETNFLLEALRTASLVLRHIAPSAGSLVKGDRTPVTAADLAVQAVWARLLERAFSEDVIVAEESAELLRLPESAELLREVLGLVRVVFPDADDDQVLAWLDRGLGQPAPRFWTLDPVDGTKGLLRGGQYAAVLALIEQGTVVLGGMACPRYPEEGGAAGESFAVAGRGQGAWRAASLDGAWRRLTVSDETDPAHARLLRSVESGRATDERLAALRRALGTAAPEVRLDSQVKYLALASGAGDLIVRLPRRGGTLRENIWDHACGVLLVEEAGGRCSDVLGEELDFGSARQMDRNLGVLASNGRLHAAALEALQRTGPVASADGTTADAAS
jgi:3'(2'), 5'-bisphosphate nucleotidase